MPDECLNSHYGKNVLFLRVKLRYIDYLCILN